MVGFTPGLAPLAARPPTPPKESTTKLVNGNSSNPHPTLANRPPLDTPDESPSSSADYFKGSSERAQKKVGFSPWTEFHKLPTAGSKESDSEGSVRRLPPSKDCKSLKSILKACADSTTSLSGNELLAFDQGSLPAMLHSTILHLASDEPASRIDAYSTLLACMSAYDEVPGTPELSEKVVELTGYIRRDVSPKTEPHKTLDTQLVIQALKVLTVFLCTPSIASQLPEEFCSFIFERALGSLEDASSSKILISHYMHLLEKQKFSPKQMNADRVNRLLSALDSVTNRVKGNRVVCHRLMIYQRLLLQAKPVMTARVQSWIDHLLSAMLSTIKDIRVRAIGFGVEAGLQLGATTSVSQVCLEVLNRESPEGKTVVEFLSSRLTEMVTSKEDGMHVPQIWSVVILFFRSRRRQLESWPHMKLWLAVIQKCLNSSDPQVKFQANIAWSRLIFAVDLGTSTSDPMAYMLRQPLISQLERRANDKTSKQAKQIARSTYCCLLYYAFRPSATHAQLDCYWGSYISQVLPVSLVATKSDVNYACDILTALFSGSGKPKAWDENRANMNGPVKPIELPCLDAKWIRLNAAEIIQIFDKLFKVANWQQDQGGEAPIMSAWRSFMTALGVASSKEIKVSMYTMKAVSQIVNLTKRILDSHTEPYREPDQKDSKQTHHGSLPDGFEKIAKIIHQAVLKIGTIPFLERRMVLTSQNSFEAAETPSSRSSRDQGSLDSPATHLLTLLLAGARQQGQSVASFVDAVKVVMAITLQSTNTRRTKLSATRNFARLYRRDRALDREAALIFWSLLAEAVSSAIRLPHHTDPHNASPQYPGPEYREATKILELGIQQHSIHLTPSWLDLHDSISASLRGEIGDEGIILTMTEPLASAIHKNNSPCGDSVLTAATAVLKNAHWSKSPNSIDRAQRLLWGPTHVSQKPVFANGVAPLEDLYIMMDSTLRAAYGTFQTLATDSVIPFIAGVTNVIYTCPQAHQEYLISRMQQGLALWIEDAMDFEREPIPSPLGTVSSSIESLGLALMTALEKLSCHHTRLLFSLQHLFLAGLSSHNKIILNIFIATWNRTFGFADTLEYPEALRLQFLRLRNIADIHLPTFPEPEIGEPQSSPIQFVESQDETTDLQVPPTAALPSPGLAKRFVRPTSIIPNTLGNSPAIKDTKSSPLVRRSLGTPPRARLRHNDSQIQFAAIESSPLVPPQSESQSLTDRQKEVRQRQGLEAAMFPEIRSSPKSAPQATKYSLPKLVFQENQDRDSKSVADEDTSPVYPPDALMKEFLGSSPTPSSSKKGRDVPRSDEDPPSSPPFVSSHLHVDQLSPAQSRGDPQVVKPLDKQDDLTNAGSTEYPATILPISARKDDSHVREAIENPDDREKNPTLSVPSKPPDDRIMSDADEFVDAPSEQTKEDAVSEQVALTSTALKSSHVEPQVHLTTDDDQVTAQLVNEMERASSQQSSQQVKTVDSQPKVGKKRKAASDENAGPPKRARKGLNSSGSQGIPETPKAGETIAECVLIDVRKVEGEKPAFPVQIKRERSRSPSIIADTQVEHETPSTKKGIRRPSKKSLGRRMSQEVSSAQNGGRDIQEHAIDEATAFIPSSRSRKSARRISSSTSSPQKASDVASSSHIPARDPSSVTKTGRIRASMRWFWSAEGSESPSQQDQDATIHPPYSDRRKLEYMDVDRLPDTQESGRSQLVPGDQASIEQNPQSQSSRSSRDPIANGNDQASSEEATNGIETGGDPPTAEGILQGFKGMLHSIKRVALGREEERAMVAVLFESVQEVHEAGRRKSGQ